MSRILLLLLTALLLGACQEEPKAEPRRKAPLEVGKEVLATAEKTTVEAGPELSGSLEPRERAELRSELSGSVRDVRVDVGEQVKKHQLLVRIETSDLGEAYASAKAAVTAAERNRRLAQRDLERTRRLLTAGAVPSRDLDAAENALKSAESQVESARSRRATAAKQLDRTTVRSPIDGTVSARPAHEGDVVSPGSPLVTVIDPSSLRLRASVPSDALPDIDVGTPVRFRVRGHPHETYDGKIQRIAPTVNPVTRLERRDFRAERLDILATLPNPNGKLLSGLYAEGRVASKERQAVVVPASAVIREGAGESALRVVEGKVERVQIETGVRDGQRVEVDTGLEPGDRVLIGPARDIAPGRRIRVTDR